MKDESSAIGGQRLEGARTQRRNKYRSANGSAFSSVTRDDFYACMLQHQLYLRAQWRLVAGRQRKRAHPSDTGRH
jgi:hypothetical protein